MSFFDDYVSYAKNNECPEEFHWWTAATILGASFRNNVWFERDYWKTYPNLWTLLIAPSGVKKTTACNIGKRMLSKQDHVTIIAENITPEKLCDELGSEVAEDNIESQGFIYAPELATFLSKKSYNEGLVSLLLRLADCPDAWERKTKGAGTTYLRNVALSFLGASTEEAMMKAIPAEALSDGFLARFICVPIIKAPIKCVPFPSADFEKESRLHDTLYRLSGIRGAMEFPKDAWDWYYQWYTHHKTQIVPRASTKMMAWYQRKPEHLMRLGMITSIALERKAAFSIAGFKLAAKKLDALDIPLEVTYASLSASDEGRDTLGILAQIEKAGGSIGHTQLLRKNSHRLNAPTFKKYMLTLMETKDIEMTRAKGKGLCYTLTQRKGGE